LIKNYLNLCSNNWTYKKIKKLEEVYESLDFGSPEATEIYVAS